MAAEPGVTSVKPARARGRIIVAAVLLVAAAAGFGWYITEGRCTNRTWFERPSPSGTRRAVVFSRSCGAKNEENTHISILERSQNLERGARGNCMIFKRGAGDMELNWKDESHLEVRYQQRDPVAQQNATCNGVSVSFTVVP